MMLDTQRLVAALSSQLQRHQAQVMSVESCTGGALMSALTEPAGASAWCFGGFVTYDNRAKIQLGVAAELIALHGAVSQAVVQAMNHAAWHAVQPHQSDRAYLCIAISGVAGPGGGSPEKPVGTVWIDVYWQAVHHSQRYHFAGERQVVRAAAVTAALQQGLQVITGSLPAR